MIQILKIVQRKVFRRSLPDLLKVCQRKKTGRGRSDNFHENILSRSFQIGIDGLETLETIDPMKLNRIKIFQGEGPVSINSSLSRAVVTGFANTKIVSSK